MSEDRVAYWQGQIRANLAPEYQSINFVIDYPTLSLLEKYGLNALNLELRNTTVKSGVTLNYSRDGEIDVGGTEVEGQIDSSVNFNDFDGLGFDVSAPVEIETFDNVSFVYDFANFDAQGNPSVRLEVLDAGNKLFDIDVELTSNMDGIWTATGRFEIGGKKKVYSAVVQGEVRQDANGDYYFSDLQGQTSVPFVKLVLDAQVGVQISVDPNTYHVTATNYSTAPIPWQASSLINSGVRDIHDNVIVNALSNNQYGYDDIVKFAEAAYRSNDVSGGTQNAIEYALNKLYGGAGIDYFETTDKGLFQSQADYIQGFFDQVVQVQGASFSGNTITTEILENNNYFDPNNIESVQDALDFLTGVIPGIEEHLKQLLADKTQGDKIAQDEKIAVEYEKADGSIGIVELGLSDVAQAELKEIQAEADSSGTIISDVTGTTTSFGTTFNTRETVVELLDGSQITRTEITLPSGSSPAVNGVTGQSVVVYDGADGRTIKERQTHFVDSNGNEHITIETKNYDGQTFIQENITDQNGVFAEGTSFVVPDTDLINDLQFIGGTAGSLLADQLADGDILKSISYKAIINTITDHFGSFTGYLASGGTFEAALEYAQGVDIDNPVAGTLLNTPEISETFVKHLTNFSGAALASVIVDEAGDALGLEGTVGGEIFNVAAGTVTTGVTTELFGVLFNDMPAGVYTSLANTGFDFSAGFYDPALDPNFNPDAFGPYQPNTTVGDYIQGQVVNALAAYAGSRLAGEFVEPESEAAAIFGSFGSALGAAVSTGSVLGTSAVSGALQSLNLALPGLGIVVGAFVGTALGTTFGNLFGSDDEPMAWAHISYSKENQEYYIGSNYGSDGGDPAVAQSMAQQVIDGINNIIDISHGKLREGTPAPRIQIGFEGNEFLVAADGGGAKSFGTAADAIHYAAFNIMKNFDLVGGHMVVMRAWHNSDAANIHEWLDDIQVAEAFQLYLTNPAGILALMMDQPDSELAQSWAAILQRAAELELHLPHEKDLDGGWGEILLAQGIDPEFIPSLDGDTLTVTDPVTGEETVMHHIIGPGYEIVRIEGTDGNDIIEVVVDGPSITYVDGGEGNDIIEGSDQADILVGGTGEDIINGNDGNDWLHGGLGDDTIDGGAGEDLVVGGQNNDYLLGSADNDHVYGNDGDDYLFGNEGQDFLFGGKGNDVLDAGSGQFDEVYGQAGDDIIHGGDGGAWQILNGGSGNDTFILEAQDGANHIDIFRGDGHDTIYGNSSTWNFIRFGSDIGVNELFFEKISDDLSIKILGEDQSVLVKDYYATGNSSLVGVKTYYGSIGAEGGGGWHSGVGQLLDVDRSVPATPAGQYNIISDADLQSATLLDTNGMWRALPDVGGFIIGSAGNEIIETTASIAIAYAGSGDDILVDQGDGFSALFGDSGDDTLHGKSGYDILVGGLGNDTVLAGSGNDRIFGGHGNDTLYGETGDDFISGGEGIDDIYAGLGDDSIEAGVGDDFIEASSGNDLARGDEGHDEIHGGSGNDTLYGGDDDDTVSGDEGVDTIFGDSGNDNLDGGDGDDRISGGAGDDTLIGGAGSDILFAGDGNDTLVYRYDDNIGSQDEYNGEAGNDKLSVYFTAAEYINTQIQRDILRYKSTDYYNNQAGITGAIFTFALFGLIAQNIEELDVYVDDVLQTISLNAYAGDVNDNSLSGSTAEDIIIGDAGNDTLQGLAGNDDLRGGLGDDDLQGGAGDDIAYGDSGNDIISGDEGDDQLFGGIGEDDISGGIGQDVIDGGDHNDTIAGNDGDDVLVGGDGDDTLTGGDGRDILIGGAGNDTLDGGLGDDLLVYRVSATDTDIIDGGAGTDVLQVIVDSATVASSSFQSDITNLQAAIDLGNSYSFTSLNLTVSNIEQVYVLTDFNGLYSPIMAVADDITVSNIGTHDITSILNNDLNFSSGNIVIESVSAAANGNVILNTNGTVTYQSDINFVGQDSFEYTIKDADGNTSIATAQITVEAAHSIPVILGDATNQTMNGTSAAEAIYGFEGNDIIYAQDGDDLLYGGEGADKLRGEGGDDYIQDISSSGTVDGYANWFWGGTGNDTMIGGTGNDIYYDGYGGATSNFIEDAGGDDWYAYMNGGDQVRITDLGGLNDHQDFATSTAVIYERYLNNDLIIKNSSGTINLIYTDQFTDLDNQTGVGIEKINVNNSWIDLKQTLLNSSSVIATRGSDDDDVINGIQIANSDDEIYAGAGNDILSGDAGNDLIFGESGDDEYLFAIGDGQDIYEDSSGNNDFIRVTSGVVLSDLVFTRENAVDLKISMPGQSTDTITVRNHFDGMAIENIVFDDASNFDLASLTLNDAPVANDDVFTVTEFQTLQGNLLLDNGNGVDSDPDGDVLSVVSGTFTTVQGGAIQVSSNGDFTYNGATGYTGLDSFSYQVADIYGGNATGNVSITVTALPEIIGTSANNTLSGTANSERVSGLAGNDLIYAYAGDDVLYGGDGADKLWGYEGDDYIEDTSTVGLVGGYTNWMYGGTGNDTMIGGSGKNIYYEGFGDAEWNLIEDAGGNDWYAYMKGGDLVRVTDMGGLDYQAFSGNNALYSSNVIYERLGNDDLVVKNTSGTVHLVYTDQFTDLNNTSGVGIEKLYVGGWIDLKPTILNYSNQITTRGSDGDDVINGIQIANPDDEIYAGAGNDVLYGDDGLDTLYGESGADTFGFRSSTAFNDVDIIKDFSIADGDSINIADVLSGYDPLADAISDFVSITDNGTDSTLMVDADGGADNFVTIALIEGVTGLSDVNNLENTGALITV